MLFLRPKTDPKSTLMFKKSLVLLLLFSLPVLGQEIVFKVSDQQLTALDREKGLLLQFSGDSLTTIDLEVFKINSKTALKLPPEFTFIEYRPIWQNNTLLLSEKDGGKVYAFENDSLVRIDRSDIVHWQSFSSLFNRNDSIYKYGGYGYWTTSNALTYLNPISKGWEIISFKSKEVPQSAYSQIHHLSKSDLFIFGGYHVNDHDRLNYIPINAVWSYHFKLRSWQYLGESDIKNIASYRRVRGDFKKTFEIFDTQKGLIKIDPHNNTVSYYTENPIYYNVAINQNLPLYKHKGFYYYYNSNDQDLILTKVAESIFIPKETTSGALYVNHRNKYYLIAITGFILFSFGFIWWLLKKRKKKKKTLLVFEHKISLNKKETFLEPAEYLILKTLIVRTALESAQLLALIYNESLTKSHNEKIKNNLIESLNLKLSYVLEGEQTPIVSEKSLEDKRIRVYSLKVSQFIVRLEK
jgi:hypothetical protein